LERGSQVFPVYRLYGLEIVLHRTAIACSGTYHHFNLLPYTAGKKNQEMSKRT